MPAYEGATPEIINHQARASGGVETGSLPPRTSLPPHLHLLALPRRYDVQTSREEMSPPSAFESPRHVLFVKTQSSMVTEVPKTAPPAAGTQGDRAGAAEVGREEGEEKRKEGRGINQRGEIGRR